MNRKLNKDSFIILSYENILVKYLLKEFFKTFSEKSIDKIVLIIYNYIAVKQFAVYAMFDFI